MHGLAGGITGVISSLQQVAQKPQLAGLVEVQVLFLHLIRGLGSLGVASIASHMLRFLYISFSAQQNVKISGKNRNIDFLILKRTQLGIVDVLQLFVVDSQLFDV